MSGDNIERQIAFIVDQQAKLNVDVAEMKERMDELTNNMERITSNISKLTDGLLGLTNIVERQGGQMAALVEHCQNSDSRTKETDARLNALIEMVERHVSGHN